MLCKFKRRSNDQSIQTYAQLFFVSLLDLQNTESIHILIAYIDAVIEPRVPSRRRY